MRLARRLPMRGPVAGRWGAHRVLSRRLVLLRASGRCEDCGARGTALEWHHTVGRRHLVGEPWASSPELTVALCPDDHRAITRGTDPELADRVLWAAAERLALTARLPIDDMRAKQWPALDVVRVLVDRLEEMG